MAIDFYVTMPSRRPVYRQQVAVSVEALRLCRRSNPVSETNQSRDISDGKSNFFNQLSNSGTATWPLGIGHSVSSIDATARKDVGIGHEAGPLTAPNQQHRKIGSIVAKLWP